MIHWQVYNPAMASTWTTVRTVVDYVIKQLLALRIAYMTLCHSGSPLVYSSLILPGSYSASPVAGSI